MNDKWQELQDAIAEWSTKQFSHQSPHSKIEHLRSELDELDKDPTDIEEFADCFMLLIDTARLSGYSMATIFVALWTRLEINKDRKWQKPDKHGVCYHIPDGDS